MSEELRSSNPLGWADVPFRGGVVRVSRHPLPPALDAGPPLSSSPDAFDGFAMPGLDSMELSEQDEGVGIQARAHAARRLWRARQGGAPHPRRGTASAGAAALLASSRGVARAGTRAGRHANCFLSGLLSGVGSWAGGPADARALPARRPQGPPEPPFAAQGRPADFGPSPPHAFPRLSQLGSSPGPFDFNPLQARPATRQRASAARAGGARAPRGRERARGRPRGAKRRQRPHVRLLMRPPLPPQFPSQQPQQHVTSSGRTVRPTGAAGGYEEVAHGGGAGGHAQRAAAKDARASFRPQQAAHAADDSNKKGCSSTYRGVRQRPWGRCARNVALRCSPLARPRRG